MKAGHKFEICVESGEVKSTINRYNLECKKNSKCVIYVYLIYTKLDLATYKYIILYSEQFASSNVKI